MDTMTKRETLTAGDILHCGWGSDMSINDYYEVTRVTPSGKTAYIRPLRKTYAGSPNDMGGCRAYPMVAGGAVSPETRKPTACIISMTDARTSGFRRSSSPSPWTWPKQRTDAMRTTTTDEGEDDIMNPIYELTDHAHSEDALAPWLDACGTGRETIDGLLLTALDCAWGNWKAAAKPPMHPYANPAYLRAAETSPWRWDDCLPAGLFTYGLDTEQWHRIIAAMNDLGRFGLVDTAIVRRDLMDGEESVLAIRDNWEVADFDACEWSDPNAADPYICVVYDLRRLAEDEDGKPRRMKGTMRYDTHYSLSGFDYLTFPAK